MPGATSAGYWRIFNPSPRVGRCICIAFVRNLRVHQQPFRTSGYVDDGWTIEPGPYSYNDWKVHTATDDVTYNMLTCTSTNVWTGTMTEACKDQDLRDWGG